MASTDDLPSTSEGSETGFETGGSDEFPYKEAPVVLDVRGLDLGSNTTCIPEFSANLQQVNLAGCNLASVPNELFCCLKTLNTLNLSLNKIETLSPKFGRFGRLRSFYADFNDLSEVPAELGCLHDLEVLSLKSNRLREIPQEFCHLANLEKISLAANGLWKSPEPLFPYWTHLRHLDLRKNALKARLDLNSIACLRYLEISENAIPEIRLETLRDLEYVDCCHNQLSKLHLNSQKLLHLNASFNNLSSLTGSSHVTSLLFLDVSNNQLPHCPPWICQNTNLAEIDLSHNLLEKLPEALLLLPRLDTLRVNHNRLRRLDVSSGARFFIRHIDLQHNEISPNIPDDFLLEAPRLEWLNASWNRLRSFPNITGFQLPFRWLLLSHNDLVDDIWSFIICCPKLRVLRLTFNNLRTIPDDLYSLTDLRDLHLTGNKLSSMPSNIPFVMAQLETLLLNCNQLASLPAFDKCQYLTRLDVSCNLLKEVNLSSLVPRSLEVLDISCNEKIGVDTDEFQQLCGDRNVSVVDTNFSGRLGPFDKNITDTALGNLHWTTGFCESDRGHSRLYINQCSQAGAKHQEVVLAICESYVKPAVCSEAKAHLADLIRDMRKKHQESEGGALARTSVALQKIIHKVYKNLEKQICPHQMSMILCHITPSEASPGFLELTILHSGAMSCIVGDMKNSSCPLQDATLDRTKFCVHQEWKSSAGAGFPQQGRQISESQFCDAIPQPQTLSLNLNVSSTSVVIFSSSMLTEALTPGKIVEEFRSSPNAVAGAKRLNDAVCSLISDRGTSVIAIDLSQSNLKGVAPVKDSPEDKKSLYAQIRPKSLVGKSVHFQPFPSEPVKQLEMKDLKSCASNSGGTSRRHWRQSKLLDEFPQNGEAYKAWEYVLEENHKKLFDQELESIGSMSTHSSLPKSSLRRNLVSLPSGTPMSRF
ncbi:PH domain leucine-rich repeat-containing protein phosphatase 1 [Galendromus occidentalis]|uniref:PH domain leucine-rich repeat-containing protein phosphatase 1 n=1 Tax=Galendromus occidentalis TaxID=34638 RepID=A0AAJ7WH73_9ACAR|nr:PH domain leucine-rich repeat-containing protein phosphatase 1 [Galendromus occidentalis]